MSNRIPTPITDKNGKQTTVHRKPFTDSSLSIERISSIAGTVESKKMHAIHTTDLGETVPTPAAYDPDNPEWYEPVVFHHYEGENPIPLAPEGYSGARCPECLCFLTRDELREGQSGDSIKCPNCNVTNNDRDYGDFNVALAAESAYLFDSDNVRAESWFHATQNKDWFNEVLESPDQPIVHVGSLDAAIARAKSVSNGSSRYEFSIYELRIKPEAEITPTILVDADNLAPNFVTDFPDYDDPDDDTEDFPDTFSPTAIGRYVNGFEDHGSVSLASVPSNFEVVGSRTFSISDIGDAKGAFGQQP